MAGACTCCRARAAAARRAAARASRSRAPVSIASSPMSATCTIARVEAAGRDDEADLAAVERDGLVRLHRRRPRPRRSTRRRRKGRRLRSTGAALALICSISARASGRGSPLNPVPNSASTITCGSPSSVSPAFASTMRTCFPRARGGGPRSRPSPPLEPPPQTTVQRSAPRKTWSATRAAAAPARSISSARSRVVGVARLGGAHLVRGVERLEAQASLATATACASSRECVIDRSIARTPPARQPPQRGREPNRRLRPADDLDLLPREGARNSEAERLADRLLAGEAARVALGRVRPRVAVRLLGGR